MYLYCTCSDWAEMYMNTLNSNIFKHIKQWIESVQTFAMSRAGGLTTTCDEPLSKEILNYCSSSTPLYKTTHLLF